MQNAQLASTIVQLSFSPAELELMFAFPLIYSIFQLVVAGIAIGCKKKLLFTLHLLIGNMIVCFGNHNINFTLKCC